MLGNPPGYTEIKQCLHMMEDAASVAKTMSMQLTQERTYPCGTRATLQQHQTRWSCRMKKSDLSSIVFHFCNLVHHFSGPSNSTPWRFGPSISFHAAGDPGIQRPRQMDVSKVVGIVSQTNRKSDQVSKPTMFIKTLD